MVRYTEREGERERERERGGRVVIRIDRKYGKWQKRAAKQRQESGIAA